MSVAISKYPFENVWKRVNTERKSSTYILNQCAEGKRLERAPTSRNAIIIAIVPIAAAS